MTTSRAHVRVCAPGKGFTLVEMLAVIAILAIIVTLVVAVAKYIAEVGARKQTETTQTLILQSIKAYYDACDAYPPDKDPIVYSDSRTYWGSPEPPISSNNQIDTNSTYLCGDGIRVLYMYLTGMHYVGIKADGIWDQGSTPASQDLSSQLCVQKAKPYLEKLPNAAWSKNDHGFRDGWGTLMRYRLVGGDKPTLISAGSDTMFTFDPNSTSTPQYTGTTYRDATGDNIRSDARSN